MIKQVQASYNPAKLEKAVREFWTKTDAYKKTKELRASGPDYYFVDGPPYTTGYIHLGTAWNKTIKDTIIRFKRMQRFNVTDTPGYDMHGLPIEVKVEQSIGVKNKKEIEEYGIDRFVGTCKEFALGFQKKMNEQFSELGVWMDWDNPYLTINSSYIEAAWWTLKRAHDKGLLVTSNRVLPGCPRCETALAEAEIEYSDEKDPSIYVKFPLRNDEKVSLLIWTTTPWTLPANMAVAAHPDFKYDKVRYRRIGETETVIVLKELVEKIREIGGWEKYDILETIEGDDLVGTEYVSPFADEVPFQREVNGKWVHKVIPSKTVEAREHRSGAYRARTRSGGLRAGQGVRHRSVLPGGRQRQVQLRCRREISGIAYQKGQSIDHRGPQGEERPVLERHHRAPFRTLLEMQHAGHFPEHAAVVPQSDRR